MKKFVIPIVVIMVAFVLLIGYSVLDSTVRSDYTSAVNEHIAYIEDHPGLQAVSVNDDECVELSLANVYVFTTAINRSALKYCLLPPLIGDWQSVTVEFPDGAVFTVYDGGRDADKDVAYIRYTVDGSSRWFSLTGFATMTRVIACTSLEGFGSPNRQA